MVGTSIIPVILSGGAGTRLWPLSHAAHPKQFHSLVSTQTLFQETVLRTSVLESAMAPLVICNEGHRFLVAEQLQQLQVTPQTIVLEPVGRNTAPAVAAAAMIATRAADASGALLLVLPADHVIADPKAFATAVETAAAAAMSGRLVTFGIVPTHPETGYGYIRQGKNNGGWSDVERFVEKPDQATAEQYVASGDYLWNSGMFLLPAATLLGELERYEPQMLADVQSAVDSAAVDADFTRLGASFSQCKAESLDYAVMERTENAAVVPLEAGWSDVGSWPALYDVFEPDSDGNVLRGDVLAIDCNNSLLRAESRSLGVIGMQDCIVVETADAVLVLPASRAQDVKQLATGFASRSKK